MLTKSAITKLQKFIFKNGFEIFVNKPIRELTVIQYMKTSKCICLSYMLACITKFTMKQSTCKNIVGCFCDESANSSTPEQRKKKEYAERYHENKCHGTVDEYFSE